MTKTQVDRLGERLRRGDISEADLRALDIYRRSFAESYERVVRALTRKLNLSPTGRPAKSTTSIIEKLRRESIRLTQMQDVAGCRIRVRDVSHQDVTLRRITALFDDVTLVDRRARPSHGYRAVHAIVRLKGQPIEIQVRTPLQHLWAELSEKLADVVDPAIKYGGGAPEFQRFLTISSELVADHENAVVDGKKLVRKASRMTDVPKRIKLEIADLKRAHHASGQRIARLFRETIREFAAKKRGV